MICTTKQSSSIALHLQLLAPMVRLHFDLDEAPSLSSTGPLPEDLVMGEINWS
jgi:hypothetical protein